VAMAERALSLLRADPDLAYRHRARAVLEFLDLRPGERVLECGCGLGFLLELVARAAECDLHGLDVSPGRLRATARVLDRRAALIVADAAWLPYRDGGFDKVILSEVLEHLLDDSAALREVYRVLRTEGVVAITVPSQHYPLLYDPVNRLLEGAGLSPIRRGPFSGIWTDHLRLYSREGIVRLVEEAGFQVAEVRATTRFCIPFSHNLFYGLGPWLLRRLSGPEGARPSQGRGGSSRLLALAARVASAIDRLNGDCYHRGPVVNICVKARRPRWHACREASL